MEKLICASCNTTETTEYRRESNELMLDLPQILDRGDGFFRNRRGL